MASNEQGWRGRGGGRGGGSGRGGHRGGGRDSNTQGSFKSAGQDVRQWNNDRRDDQTNQGPPRVQAHVNQASNGGGSWRREGDPSGSGLAPPPRAIRMGAQQNPATTAASGPDPKKLLILDINGVLLRREDYAPGKKRSYVMRPHWEAFLEWCFANFACALWSCGKRETLEMDVFGKFRDRLLFVFDQEKSTSLWPRRSVVAAEKPLFLKELRNLWAEDVRWNENNTILLDNHSEKFERNPPGTCFQVPDYVADDDVLKLDGPLVQHLSAMRDASNLAEYAESHKNLPYFAYMTAERPVEASMDPRALRQEMTRLFVSSIVMQTMSPERDEQFYLTHNDTFGPRAVPFRRRDLSMLLEYASGYSVCEKTDGKRMLFFVPAAPNPSATKETETSEGKPRMGFFVDRAWNFEPVMIEQSSPLYEISKSGGTILDGELVAESEIDCAFLVFDAVFINGEDVGAILELNTRLARVAKVFGERCLAKYHSLPCIFVVKPMRRLNEIAKVNPSEAEYPGIKSKLHCDGFVFTPSRNTSYYQTTVLKFKPIEHLTIDFAADLASTTSSSATELLVPLFLEHARTGVLLLDQAAQAKLDAAVSKHQQQRRGGGPPVVVECSFDPSRGVWKLMNVRKDKRKSNGLSTGWSVLETVVENVQVVELVERLSAAQITEKRLVNRSILDAKTAKEHYDERQKQRDEDQELDKRIAMVRRANNFVKSVLISTKGEVPVLDQVKVANVPHVPSRLATLSNQFAGNRSRNRGPRGDQSDRPLKVLDLACGRGGDLNKWFGAYKLDTYVGADVSPVALKEAASRAASISEAKNTRCAFVECDGREEGWSRKVLEAAEGFQGGFDVVSIQLAVHYFCESREKALSFFKEVRSICLPHARVLVTMLDEPVVTVRTGAKMEWNNGVCKVDMLDRDEFGATISFTLGDAVVDLPEPLPNLQSFNQILAESGFALRKRANVSAFIDRLCATKDPLVEDLHSMLIKDRLNRGMTLDEWQVLELYCMVVIDAV